MTRTTDAPRRGYRTIDLVVTAGIGVAFGVAFLGYGQIYTLLTPLTSLFQPLEGLLMGMWFLPAIIAALVVRKPGAAIGAELLAAVLEMFLGGQWGWGTVASGILQGGGVELAFALTAYRRFTLPVAVLGGAIAAVLEGLYERFAYYPEMTWTFAGIFLVLGVLSGIVLCGVLGWLATRALASTGALDSFGPGRDLAASQRG